MGPERATEQTSKRELVRKDPSLIQRCMIEQRDGEERLIYDYMGSSEFEFGDQSKSLRRIFALGITEYKVNVHTSQNDSVPFYLIGGNDFDSRSYAHVIDGLIEQKFRIRENTYLRETLDKILNKSNIDKDEQRNLNTEVWFDFTNDVLFTPFEDKAEKVKTVIERIKINWETPDTPEVKAFKKRRDKINKLLDKRGVSFHYIGAKPEMVRGKMMVWFNDGGEHSEWCTLDQLEAWDGKSKVPGPRKAKELLKNTHK